MSGNRSSKGEHFSGRYRVVDGRAHISPEFPFVRIAPKEGEDGVYTLSSENSGGARRTTQDLKFNPETGMLENIGKHDQERRIAFWDRSPKRTCIFAMRRAPEAGVPCVLLPWEQENDDGAWGAEQG